MFRSLQMKQIAGFLWLMLLVAAALITRLAPTETAPTVSAQLGPPTACVREALGNPQGNICTSNRVSISAITIPQNGIIEPCEFPGDTATVIMQLAVQSTAQTSYDVGLWINTKGLSAEEDLTDGCFRDHLRPVSATNGDLNLTGGSGPFYNAEIGVSPTDTCGDIDSNTTAYYTIQPLQITCNDTTGDGQPDISTCTSWIQSNGTTCTTTAHALPGETSHCNCSDVTVPIQVPPVDLDIDKRIQGGQTTVIPGETFTYEIEVSHEYPPPPSTEQAVNVKVADDIDPRLKVVSAMVPGGSCATTGTVNGILGDPGYNGELECTLANLSPGGSAIITLEVLVDPGLAGEAPQSIDNEACVSGNGQTTNNPIGVYPDDPDDLNRICDDVTISTPVVVSYFNATSTGDGVRFDWSTAKEMGNVGFNLYVVTENGRELINEAPILSNVVDSFGPEDYNYEVAGLSGDTFYLEDIALWGEKRLSGPFTLGEAYGDRLQPDAIDWVAINAENDALEAERAAAASQSAITATRAATEARTAGSRFLRWAYETFGTQGQPGGEATQAAYPALELTVKSDGIYRVTYESIKAGTGVDLNGVSGKDLALTNRYGTVPIYVSANTFGPGAYVEFYGQGLDTLYTDDNVYRLEVNPAQASRVQTSNAKVPRKVTYPNSFVDTVVIENNTLYSVWSPTNDPWVADVMNTGQNKPLTRTFALPVVNYTGGAATLDVKVWGFIEGAYNGKHHVQVAFNGVQVADSKFEEAAAPLITAQIASGVVNGNNTLSLTLPADRGSGDMVALESYSLTYPRAFQATGGQLDFTAAGQAFRVNGLNSDQLVVYRVVNGRPTRLQAISVAGNGGNYQASFAGSVEAASYYVSTVAALQSPTIQVALDKEDITSGSADLLIISHPNFIDGFQPLVDARTSEGYAVKLVDVNQVYANYSGGVFDAQAIQSYIRHAILNMGVEYIILGGGDTLNYRAYPWAYDWGQQPGRSISFMPSLYGANIQGVRYAPMDPLYTDVDGDRVPDAAIGRFPARTVAELERMVAKTLAFNDGINDNLQTALLAAGNGFQSDSNSLRAGLLKSGLDSSWDVTTAYVGDLTNEGARTAFFNAIPSNPRLVSFIGHSNEWYWGITPTLFSTWSADDMSKLTNTEPMVLTQWGCSNTNYTDPTFNTLGHAFLLGGTGNNGAAVVAGATSLAMDKSEREFGKLLVPYMVQQDRTMGSAVQQAKIDLASKYPGMVDVILGWTILGDPTVVLQP